MQNRKLLSALALTLLGLAACTRVQQSGEEPWVATAPAGERPTRIDREGETIIPNGRIVRPYGKTVTVAPHPFGLTLSPDGRVAVTANSGFRPFSISIVRNLEGAPRVQQIPEGAENDESVLESVFMGLAITPDNRFVYVAGGESNQIFKIDLTTGAKVEAIDCAVVDGDRDFTHGYLGDLILSRDGSRLYVVDQIGFRLIIIDTETKAILHNVPTGRYPFGVALSPDEDAVYVANVGMFEYKRIRSVDPNTRQEPAAEFPAFGYGTEEMETGYRNDTLDVPGLGDPNASEAFSVWRIALDDPPRISHKVKTGFLVGEMVEGIPAVGGASPNSLVATDRYVFVSNGNNDCVSAIDFERGTVASNIFLKPEPRLSHLRGVIPFGLGISPDGRRLYVAEAGINSVGVIDVETLEVIGHIPAGWFPSKLEVTPDGRRLIVANAKGFGSGPNGGIAFELGPEGTYIGNLMMGSITVVDIPTDEQMAELTQQVIDNNYRFERAGARDSGGRRDNPIPRFPGEKKSPLEHIVFISKENRTYDEVFGQVKGGDGDPTLARYGVNRTFARKDGSANVTGVTVMPNHLALAERFSISDNFYVDADVSADGHRWLVNTFPNEWVETHVAAASGGKRGMREDSTSPGNLALVGSSGAIYPEDYNEAGSIWEHFDRHSVRFFNFGFGMQLAGSLADATMKYTGVRYRVNFPIPGPLFDHSSRKFATYNMAIPDQFRVDMFLEEFRDRWVDGDENLPQVLTIYLPNDHGAGERPEAGYPYRESYMMDNDLALGRIVEFLTQSSYWKKMAIFITEDDAQDGRDHVDAHRSLLMVLSPYAKRNYVGHQHYSFGSIFKTFWHILGLPYLNQYDATATDLADLFTAEPDFTPYDAYPVDPRVFDPEKVLNPFDEDFDWQAVVESPKLDNVEDFLKSRDEHR